MSLALVFNDGCTARWLAAVEQFKVYAMAESPREACALILADGSLRPAANIHPDPENEFIIEPSAWVGVEAVAVLHSHTPGQNAQGQPTMPFYGVTRLDLDEQIKTELPWGIVLCNHEFAQDPFWFGDQVPAAPLVGRTFISGKWDCYSLIRDWHWEAHGIRLHNEGRDMDWWLSDTPPCFYDQFEKHGFRRVVRGLNPVPGDIFLCKVHSPVLNHAGVYLGEDGMILHHLNFALSARTPAIRWQRKMDFLIRHVDLKDPE